jgi:iron complex transport system substrate-binding protein
MSFSRWPSRVVCLTEETTEVLYRIGAGDKVVGVSGYTVRPKEARKKPKVSAFISADVDKIIGLQPDLVLTFSDLQADISAELQKRGLWVVSFNQRSVDEILRAIALTGALVGLADRGQQLADELADRIEAIRRFGATLPRRPKVFFEEWPDPLISGIRWVSELIQIAGGEDILPECARSQAAKGRIVTPEQVVERQPDLIVASWCGRKARPEKIAGRPGWSELPAVRNGWVEEIKSTYILQPGPASLLDGLDQLHALVVRCATGERGSFSLNSRASDSSVKSML